MEPPLITDDMRRENGQNMIVFIEASGIPDGKPYCHETVSLLYIVMILALV